MIPGSIFCKGQGSSTWPTHEYGESNEVAKICMYFPKCWVLLTISLYFLQSSLHSIAMTLEQQQPGEDKLRYFSLADEVVTSLHRFFPFPHVSPAGSSIVPCVQSSHQGLPGQLPSPLHWRGVQQWKWPFLTVVSVILLRIRNAHEQSTVLERVRNTGLIPRPSSAPDSIADCMCQNWSWERPGNKGHYNATLVKTVV